MSTCRLSSLNFQRGRPLLRCLRRSAVLAVTASLAGALLVLYGPPTRSHESEQYTLPAGRDFAELGPHFSAIFYRAVAGAAADANAAIAAAIEEGRTELQISELQTPDYIAGKVWERIFLAIPTNELLDFALVSPSMQARYPGLVTMYRPAVSIYDDPLLVIDLTKFVRTFFRAGTVTVNGTVIGTDKLVHFINVGRIYHAKYETRIQRGLSEQEAVRSAIASTARNPLTSEDGVLGMWTTGIHSNGDLAADYAGMHFYRNLTAPVRIGSRVLPPMLVRDGAYWKVQVDPDSEFFTAFITPHWNEVLNPNKYVGYTRGRLRALVRDRCSDALAWYRDRHGQRRGRAQFEAIARELSLYDGEDYGHKGNPRSPVALADVCFPGESGAAVVAAGGSRAVPSAEKGANPDAGGPDPFGRTPLWWAARDGDVARVRQLAVKSEIDVADVDGETPLHAAARGGSVEIARELLARGANPNRSALYGKTPLMLASSGGRTDVASALLLGAADPNARDLFGQTPLHAAAQRGNTMLSRRLLEHGADPSIADDAGKTALHLAARRGNEAVVATLAAHGADPTARNAAGVAPKEEAGRHGHEGVAERLRLSAGAGANGATTAAVQTAAGGVRAAPSASGSTMPLESLAPAGTGRR